MLIAVWTGTCLVNMFKVVRLYLSAQMENINHPKHYNSHPSGIECIVITEHMSFNLGNAVKYIWRAFLKSEDWKTDLQKAVWCINREIERLSK